MKNLQWPWGSSQGSKSYKCVETGRISHVSRHANHAERTGRTNFEESSEEKPLTKKKWQQHEKLRQKIAQGRKEEDEKKGR